MSVTSHVIDVMYGVRELGVMLFVVFFMPFALIMVFLGCFCWITASDCFICIYVV